MSYEPSTHEAQATILRYLLFHTGGAYKVLQDATGLTSDHVNFHIKKLLQEEYVQKVDSLYVLTAKGKEYANRMDTDDNSIERQPKISVAITLERVNEKGVKEFLFQQRKKNPYFDFWGRAGGKIRWGESIINAAERELKEETGLEADFRYQMLYHKRDFEKESGKLLEDKIFLCVYANTYRGTLIEEFEGGVNCWMTLSEFKQKEKRFKSVDEFFDLIDQGISFSERNAYYEAREY